MYCEKLAPYKIREILFSSGIPYARKIDEEIYKRWKEGNPPAVAHGPAHNHRASYFGLKYYLENPFVGKEKITPDMVVNALLLHDISKTGGIINTKDAKKSAEISHDILKKYYGNKEQEKVERICEAINYHTDPFEDKDPKDVDPLTILVYIGDKMDMSSDRVLAYVSWLNYVTEKKSEEGVNSPYKLLQAWFERMVKTTEIFHKIGEVVPNASYIYFSHGKNQCRMEFGTGNKQIIVETEKPNNLDELFEVIKENYGESRTENLKKFMERYEINDAVIGENFLFMQVDQGNGNYLRGLLIPNIKNEDVEPILNTLWRNGDSLLLSSLKIDEIYSTHQETTCNLFKNMHDEENWTTMLMHGLLKDMIENIRYMEVAGVKKEDFPKILAEYKKVLWDSSFSDDACKKIEEINLKGLLCGIEGEIDEKEIKLLKYVLFDDENYDLTLSEEDFAQLSDSLQISLT